MKQKESIFQRPLFVALFALSAALGWGFAFPLVKLGFAEFGIEADMTASKMLFAGMRFCVAGIFILISAKISGLSFKLQGRGSAAHILAFALMNTTIHYALFYIGISHSQGSRASVVNSLGVFLIVILACIFFESDKFDKRKVIGCVLGLSGIAMMNIGGAASGGFTFMGDGMIILNTTCSAIAGLMTRGLSKRCNIIVATGYSLAIGGALLIIPALLFGATLPSITAKGITYLFLLICISSFGFGLYNKLLSCNPIGRVAIFNSLIPIIGTTSSCIILHEPFYPKYAIALLLTSLGIFVINYHSRDAIKKA